VVTGKPTFHYQSDLTGKHTIPSVVIAACLPACLPMMNFDYPRTILSRWMVLIYFCFSLFL
jgi:hypothetical protein